ncbi:MAG: AraC family transcriptional regulator [Verrucomicrobia bacterium]|nr:AraC family transcriptional regulator [Verrucomicrobiota bacterium]
MKLHFEKISLQNQRSIHILELCKPEFDAPWHYHPEWELTLIQAGRGKRFVGNHIEPFAAGDLVLLGPNLPHFWHSERPTGESAPQPDRAIVVQFPDAFLGDVFLNLPEMEGVRQLFRQGNRGMVFDCGANTEVTGLLEALPEQAALGRLLSLVNILQKLSESPARTLSQNFFTSASELEACTRLGKAYTFLLAHFQEPLTLGEIAAAAAMSSAAFSRFFKRMTKRNLWDILNELRIDHACRLLRETDRDITSIAFESGFGTLSSFNRHFQHSRRCTPSAYRKALEVGSMSTEFDLGS